jgi:hypothetical protein
MIFSDPDVESTRFGEAPARLRLEAMHSSRSPLVTNPIRHLQDPQLPLDDIFALIALSQSHITALVFATNGAAATRTYVALTSSNI